MLCPKCETHMNLNYFFDDEVEVYHCDNCNNHIDVSISYEIDCVTSKEEWVRHEVSFTDFKHFQSSIKWIEESGQKIIGIKKTITQTKMDFMSMEDFNKILKEHKCDFDTEE